MKLKISDKFLNRTLITLGSILAIVSGVLFYSAFNYKVNNNSKVVLLYSEQGSCTGTLINLQNRYYTLTAAHCAVLINNNRILGLDENRREIEMRVLKIDREVDLMLLTSPFKRGLEIGEDTKQHDKVTSTGHGHGMPTYTFDGEILYTNHPVDQICTAKLTLFNIEISCIGPTSATVATAAIIPGSSGGPLIDASSKLVGIAHAIRTDAPTFSYFVSVQDIRYFLREF